MKILYEQTDFFIIYKNPGVEFHGVNGVLEQLRRQHDVYGVHRLDKDTSGLMLVARTKESQSILSELFAQKKVRKFYMALADKKPVKKMGRIKGGLEKSRNGSYKLTRSSDNLSITDFKSILLSGGLRLFDLRPLTGKTHQLRVVMKSQGAAILGDKRYGGAESDRMYLHAYRIKFEYDDELIDFSFYPTEGELFLRFKEDIKRVISDFVESYSETQPQFVDDLNNQ